ncbi:MAG: dockerin type I repeat-containing protein [Bacillota bacterium]|nr:dockerin type I repeat-containing protein [Bacillota bacterium]
MKKQILIILAATLIFSCFSLGFTANAVNVPTETSTEAFTQPTYPAPEPITYILGDVNRDNVVNLKDATALQRFLANVDNSYYDEISLTGDTNQDGTVTLKDASTLQKYFVDLVPQGNIGKQITIYPCT